ncbi:MAG: SusC/RagA family TonB-linked outer membrane protein [Mangrovibacterium sp.]
MRKQIQGTVTDASGLPLPGVTVVIKNTTQGTITDFEGHYSLQNIRGDDVLVFSFVGMKTEEIPVAGKIKIDLVMTEESIGLKEVVAIGYGTMKKSDLTGSVASVTADKIKERSYSNVMQSLSGQLPGVTITQSSGAPGMAPSIRVRGASSITSGTTPLYVIDGVPLEDTTPTGNGQYGNKNLDYNMNPLNTINPNDIESVEVLKDASSAAIYGSRGANGVVLITTKHGKAGQTRVEGSYEFGISEVARKIEMMNAPEFIEWTRYYRNNSWQTSGGNWDDPNSVRPLNRQIPSMFDDPEWLQRIGTGTDWQDVLFRTAYTHNVQVLASGGTEKTQFMFSSGYLDSEGVVENSYYDRLNLRSNVRHKFSDYFTGGVNLSVARTKSQMFGEAGKSDAVSFALQSDPLFPVFTENGTLSHRDTNSIWNVFQPYSFQLWHPYAFTRESENEKIGYNILSTAFLDYTIIPDLTFRTSISGTVDNQLYQDYRNKGQNYGHEQYRDAEANERTQFLFNWIWENTLNYNKTINDHSFTGLLGYSVQKQRVDNGEKTGTGFPNDLVKTMNAATQITSAPSTRAEWSIISYITRATYAYQGKYLISAALRADGSSRFGSNNRWGYFPSASLGWRMSEESFMQGTRDWLDNLKLRVSYGVTGNNQIQNYAAISQMEYGTYVFDGQLVSGMHQSNYADKNLKWEKTSQVNIGLDGSFFNNRLNVTYDYYYSKTKDLLLNVPIPDILGFSSTLTNIGELENQGMEFLVSSRNLTGAFKWNTEFNISGNRNKVLKLGPNDSPIQMSNNHCNILIEVGKTLGNYYGYQYDGVIMSAAEMNQYPVFAGSEPGDPKIRDVSGPDGVPDGVVDSNDRTIIGNYQPDFTWGLTNSFMYKGFDLSVMLTGSEGGEIMNQQSRFTLIGRANRGVYKRAFNFWRSEAEPGDGWHYKPRDGESSMQNQCSSYWVEDGSFVRIKNIRLGYTFSNQLAKRLGASSVKVYLNVENVHVFSDYTNYDPEASSFQTGIFRGFDYGAYPNPRVWTMGINFNF